jgi:SAM-dependent methyltransferase
MAEQGVGRGFGFTDVDESGRVDVLQEMLATQAVAFETARRRRFPLLGLRPGDHALDVGCGLGEVAAALADLVGPTGRVVGLDASQAMVDRAAAATAAISQVEVVHGDVLALDFPDGSFDAVHSERVFMHLEDPATGIAEVVRVAKPGGRVMIVDPDHGMHGLDADDIEAADVIERWLIDNRIKNPRSGLLLTNQLRDAGLVDVEVRGELEVFQEPLYGPERQIAYLADAARGASEEGLVSADRADLFVADIRRRIGDGRYLGAATMFTVVGTKPSV